MSLLSSLITAIYSGSTSKVYPQYVSMLINGDSGVLPFTYNPVAAPTSAPISQLNNVRNDPFNPLQGNGNYGTQFNGTSEYFIAANHSSFDLGSGDFTLEFWLNLATLPAALTRITGITNSTVSTAADEGVSFEVGATNFMTFSVASGTTLYQVISAKPVVSSEWEHWAACRSGGTLNLYRNGVAQTAGTSIGAASVNWGGAFRAIVGSWTGTSRFLRGILSNLRVVKGTALYTTNFIVPDTGLTAVSGTSLLTCSAASVKDLSPNAHTLTFTGTPSVTYANPIPTASVLARQYNGSVLFNGTDSYYTVGYTAALSFTADFTFELYVKPDNAVYGVLAGSTGNGFLINRNADGTVSVYFSGTGTTLSSVIGAAPVGKWTHVAWTRTGNTACLWVNGMLAASGTQAAGTHTLGLSIGATLYIGSRADGTNKFTGSIANLNVVKGSALYTEPFFPPVAPSVVTTNTSLLTMQGDAVDRSNTPLVLTTFGLPAPQQPVTPFNTVVLMPPVTGGVYLSGVASNCVNLPLSYNSSVGALAGHRTTIEFWMNTQNMQSQLAMDLFGNTRSGTVNGKYSITLSSTAVTAQQKISFFYSTSTSGGLTLTTTAVIPQKQWNHIAVEVNATTAANSTVTVYINGVGQTFTGVDLSTHTADPALVFGLGYIAGVQAGYSGYMSNFRIVRDSQVYSTDFTLPSSALTAVSGTQVLTFQQQGPVSNLGVLDTSGMGTKITTYGLTAQGSSNPSRSGWSVYFNGSSSVYTDVQAEFNSAAGDWSMEGWFMFTTLAVQGQELFRFEGSTNFNPYLMVWNDGTMLLRAQQTGTNIVSPFTHSMVVNTWYHWAVTKIGNTFTVYRDGNVITSGSYSGLISESKRLRIGTSFTGYISNMHFVNTASLYTAAFVPPQYAADLTDNTQLLLFQGPDLIDGSENSFALTSVGLPTPRHFGPVAKETFSTYTAAVEGGSVYFAGAASDYMTATSGMHWVFKGDYTQEAWVYPITGGVTTDMNIFSTTTSGGDDVFIITPGVGTARIRHCYLAVGSTYLTQTATIPFNTWTHVAVSRSGSTLKAFVNGVQVYSGTVTGNIGTNAVAFTGKCGDNTSMFKGYISSLCISNVCKYTSEFLPKDTVLEPSTNTLLLVTGTNGGIIDQATRTNFRATGNVTLSTTVKKYGTTALYFGTTSAYLRPSADALTELAFGTEDFTVEMWINKSVVGTNHGLLKLGGGATNLNMYVHQSNSVTVAVNGSTTLTQSAAETLVADAWTHVAISRAGSTLRLFINGVLQTSVTNTTAFTVDPDQSSILGLSTTNFVGYADDIRITRGHALYTGNFDPPSETLPI